jgi:hypothetical protein
MKALPTDSLKNRYNRIKHSLTETTRRRWAGTEAVEIGYGGIIAVARATGMSPMTVGKAAREVLEPPPAPEPGRGRQPQRRPGGGRKKLSARDPAIGEILESIIEPYTSGDPMGPLRWTCKSTTLLAAELTRRGHPVSADTVARLLKEKGYSLQGNRKRFEGAQHEDRNAQFEYIAACTEAFQARGSAAISVDTKKKELVGNYRNAGREWTPKGIPLEVEAYDFIDEDKGKAIPYGIYDTSHNLGWVNVGTDHDTAQFAVRSIARWWGEMGEWLHPGAREILIMADGGGSNGWRNRLWKKSLQEWADREQLTVMVCHFPPGTSKWNKIEHRMFCHITRNWRGRPLVSHEAIISLIGATTTATGLRIRAELDKGSYPKGLKVSDEEFARMSIERADFHGEWNYCIKPRVI